MQIFKSLFVLFTLALFTGNVAFAQQAIESSACEFLVSQEEAFSSIKITEASLNPGAAEITVEAQVDDKKPCIMQLVTPAALFFEKGRLKVQVARNEGEPNIRVALLDNVGEVKGSSFDVEKACMTYETTRSVIIGCGPPE